MSKRYLTIPESAAALSELLPPIENLEAKLSAYADRWGPVTVSRLVSRARSLADREYPLHPLVDEITDTPKKRPSITQCYAPAITDL